MNRRFWLASGILCMSGTVWPDMTALKDRLLSADSSTVTQALQEVDGLGPQDRKLLVLNLLTPLRRDADSAKAAAQALGHCGKEAETALPDLMEALRYYDDPAVGAAVGEALIKIGSPSIRPLIKALGDPNFLVRQRAATILGGFGADARKAVPALVELLQDTHTQVQTAAEETLLKIGEPALSSVASELKKSRADDRKTLVTFLARFGPPASVPLVQALSKDDNAYVRANAATALAGLRPAAAPVVPALIAALKDPDDNVRRAAVSTLGELGTEAKAAIGPLIGAAHLDSEVLVRQRSLQALESIGRGSKESLSGLLSNLKVSQTDVRRQTVITLGQAEIPEEEKIAAFALTIKDPDASVRGETVQIVSALAKTTPQAVTVLRMALLDQDKKIRAFAISALGEAGKNPAATESVLQGLEETLRDPDPGVRNQGILALAQVGPPAVPTLLRGMNDSYAPLADRAEQTIIDMGPEAVPALEKAQSTDLVVQKRAADLIAQIQGQPKRRPPSSKPSTQRKKSR